MTEQIHLAELTDGPSGLRRQLVRAVLEAGEGDEGLFFSVAQLSDGTRVPNEVVTMHTPGGYEFFRDHAEFMPDPTTAPTREAAGFVGVLPIFGSWEQFEQRTYTQRIGERFGLCDQVRMLAFHGDHFLGWLGVLRRCGAPRFSANNRRRLAPLVSQAVTQLAAAEALEQAHLPKGPGWLLVSPEGKVEHASAEASPWLGRTGFRETLARTVCSLDQGQSETRPVPLQAAEALFTRMSGPGGTRYLVCVKPATRPRRHALAALSPMQRRIAEFIAAGVQRGEVASELGLSPETVRSHVRVILERLGVANRLELARLLQEESGRLTP
jgi:DNA-binding CsgD family transcriptional regulator